jgi:hypothetical protein
MSLFNLQVIPQEVPAGHLQKYSVMLDGVELGMIVKISFGRYEAYCYRNGALRECGRSAGYSGDMASVDAVSAILRYADRSI